MKSDIILLQKIKTIIYLSSIVLVILIGSCSTESMDGEISKSVDYSAFSGDYTMTVNHITGIHSQYDSIGNFLGFGIDSLYNVTMQIDINQYENSDSLIINGLITSHLLNCCVKEVYGKIENDSIKLLREFNQDNNNDYVRGSIVFHDNSLTIDYRWDSSDTWSTEAFPTYGLVVGSGEF